MVPAAEWGDGVLATAVAAADRDSEISDMVGVAVERI